MHTTSPIIAVAALLIAMYAHAQPAGLHRLEARQIEHLDTPCTLWTKHPDPVWEGLFMAADPSVIRDGDTYRMYFTGFLSEPDRSVIGIATSSDGINWDWATTTDDNNPISIALDGRPGQWDQYLETVHVMKVGDEFWMYYTGYIPNETILVSPYEIGLATSPDGINWTRVSDDPVYRLAQSGPDNGAMTSPAVVQWNGMFFMIYLGWQLDDQGGFVDFRIRGATSPDGINWTRREQPVFGPPSDELPWLDSAIEPTLLQASDGMFYLFITADDEENTSSPTSIALLRSCHPFGPWEACPSDPILTMTRPWEDAEIVAPSVMEDEGKLRMWYHGLTFNDSVTGERFRIGYAETNFDANPARFDVDGNGRVDIDDLYEQHQNPVDIDLDGTITPADNAVLEAFLRRCELQGLVARKH
ncbi:MAG: hypothetical protein ACWA5W_03240 [Phycisphaerales bacterium]